MRFEISFANLADMDITTYLKEHNLSQEEFGQLIGVSQGRVSQLIAECKDGRGIDIERAKTIVRATGGEITPHDLMPETFPFGFRFPAKKKAAA